ncbi:MAG TPA: hypothetical protein VK324_11590, partial [Tepidisphaeraceae bacterium]|nr:hypothetical protein [Tepidisphaeraceae bacterium]
MGYALPPRVVLVTEKRVSRAWAAGRHAHRDVHELIVVTEGCIHASAGGSLLEAAAGGSIVYPAGCAHEEHAVAGGGASLVCVWWRGPLGDPALGKAGPTVRADRAGHVEQAARWLLRVWNEGADDVSPTGGASSAAADILAALLWERDCPPRRA